MILSHSQQSTPFLELCLNQHQCMFALWEMTVLSSQAKGCAQIAFAKLLDELPSNVIVKRKRYHYSKASLLEKILENGQNCATC